MRIGLDLREAEDGAGVARYGRCLSAALLAAAVPEDEFIAFRRPKRKIPFWTSQVGASWAFLCARLDLLHVLGGSSPILYRKPFVMTVHDLAIYRHPEWFPDGQWFSTRFALPRAVRRASHVIVPSASTKKDLQEIFGVPDDRITVIPHGSTPLSGAPPAEEGDGSYILFLGTIEPRKNVVGLVRAYRRLVDGNPELGRFELRLAGRVGWKSETIVDEIRKTQCQGYRISMAGQVPDGERERLLRGASAFAYPSFHEGFGLPVLEALGMGVPTVVSDNSALPEVAGPAALYVPATDEDALASALLKLLTDKKTAADLRQKGLSRAKEFSWEKTARATAGVYRAFSSAP